MEKELLDKLSVITDEEKRLLSGGKIEASDYTVDKGFNINAAKVRGDIPYIFQRMHPRFAPFPPHTHDYVEMMTVVSGSITHHIDGKDIPLEAGDILIMNKHICHSIDNTTKDDLGVNVIMADSFFLDINHELHGTVFEDFARENAKKDGAPMYLNFKTRGEKQIENILENLFFELINYTPDTGIMTRTVGLLFKYLSLKSKKLLISSTKSFTPGERRMGEISEYISANLRGASLTELGKFLKLSPPYLSKITKEYFGKSFKEILVECRMEKALELVKKSDMQIGQIIDTVGYENESYFHREFKKKYGTSPLSMRRQMKNI